MINSCARLPPVALTYNYPTQGPRQDGMLYLTLQNLRNAATRKQQVWERTANALFTKPQEMRAQQRGSSLLPEDSMLDQRRRLLANA